MKKKKKDLYCLFLFIESVLQNHCVISRNLTEIVVIKMPEIAMGVEELLKMSVMSRNVVLHFIRVCLNSKIQCFL